MSQQHTFEFELGEAVKDVITGLSGPVTSQHHYMTGCDQYGVTQEGLFDGEPKVVFLDVNRLIRVEDRAKVVLPNYQEADGGEVAGGPQAHPSKG